MKQTLNPTLPDLFPVGSVVLFTGDSITHGGRGGDMNHYLGHGYAAEIAMRYLGYMPDKGLQFANRGVSGDSSGRLVARWREDAFPFTPGETGYGSSFPESANHPLVPDFLSILVGVNDLHGDRRDRPVLYGLRRYGDREHSRARPRLGRGDDARHLHGRRRKRLYLQALRRELFRADPGADHPPAAAERHGAHGRTGGFDCGSRRQRRSISVVSQKCGKDEILKEQRDRCRV